MYPFITPEPGTPASSWRRWTSLDDTAALSDIYPGPGWPANKGTIRGRILDSSGNPVTGINVIARNISDPFHDCTSYISGQVSKGHGRTRRLVRDERPDAGRQLRSLHRPAHGRGLLGARCRSCCPDPRSTSTAPWRAATVRPTTAARWSPVAATAGSPVTLDITFNHLPGAPTFITAPDLSVQSIPFDITPDGGVVVGGAGFDGPRSSAGT